MTQHTDHKRGDYLTVVALVVACLNASLVQTTVLAVQPQLPQLLDAEPATTAWVVTATIATACATIPTIGRLGDVLGLKRVAVALLLVLIAGSLLAVFAPNLPTLIAGRALQGLSLGLIPLGVSIIRLSVLPSRLPVSLGFISSSMGVGAALGIPVGAALATGFGWRGIFGSSVVTGVLALVLVCIWVPTVGQPSRTRFDWLGAAGTAGGSALVLIGLGDGLGLGLPARVVALLCGLAVLGGTIIYMLRARNPLIHVRTSMTVSVIAANVASFLLNFGVMTTLLVYPRLLTDLSSVTAIVVGFVMMVGGLSQAIGAPLLAQATRFLRPPWTVFFGCALAAIGTGVPLFAGHGTVAVLIANLILGAGFGLAFAAVPRVVMALVPESGLAAANGVNAQIRMFGTAGSAAVVGALLSMSVSPDLISPIWLAVVASAAAATLTILMRPRPTRTHLAH